MNNNTTNKDNQVTDATPEEVLNYFTSNQNDTEKQTAEAARKLPEAKSSDDSVEISVKRSDLKEFGLDPEDIKQENEKDNNPMSQVPVPELYDPTMYDDLLGKFQMSATQSHAFVDLSTITVTENEKELYLRVLLDGNTPFYTNVPIIPNRNIFIKCYSKTTKEQNFINKKITEFAAAVDENKNYKNDVVATCMYALKLNAMFTCLDDFKNIVLNENSEVVNKEDFNYNMNVIDSMPTARWNLFVNAMRIFEKKESILGEMVVTGDF